MLKYDKLIIYTDGGSRGNPGPSAVGVVMKDKTGKNVKTYSEYLGDNMTNNQAEYSGVILAMTKAKLMGAKGSELEFYLDSELVVNQLSQKFKIKDVKLGSLFVKIWNMTTDFKKVTYQHVPREKNTEADALVNEVLDSHR